MKLGAAVAALVMGVGLSVPCASAQPSADLAASCVTAGPGQGELRPAGAKAELIPLPALRFKHAVFPGARVAAAHSTDADQPRFIDQPDLRAAGDLITKGEPVFENGAPLTLPTGEVTNGMIQNAGEDPLILVLHVGHEVVRVELAAGEAMFIGPRRTLEATHQCECHCTCDAGDLGPQAMSFKCDSGESTDPCPSANGDRCAMRDGTGGLVRGVTGDCARVWEPIATPPRR